MQFAEIRKELKKVPFVTVREESGDYFEAVVSRNELANLALKLEKFFGPRIWPSKNKLSDEVEMSIKEFGGIMDDQALYFSKQNNKIVFAMLWPWSNGTHITLKIGNSSAI
jgi:hypothetical protein